jgi:IclR family transcriptional regulator, KDG regulon repressor
LVRTVNRAIQILQLLMGKGPMGGSEISRALRIPKSSAHNILETLVAARLVERDEERGVYHLGSKLIELGDRARQGMTIQRVARPHLKALNQDLDDTVHLTVLDHDEVLYVDCIEGRKPLRMHSVIGVRAPLYCTAVGKAIMAWLPSPDVDRIVRTQGLAAFTATTITRRKALEDELARTRRRGYAVDNMEHEELLRCVGAAVRDHTGAVVGAISVAGPSQRITVRSVAAIAPRVMAAADAISAGLGCRDSGNG